MNIKPYYIRFLVGMVISLLVCAGYALWAKKFLSEQEFTINVRSNQSIHGYMQLYIDSGQGFNEEQKWLAQTNKGQNSTQFKLKLDELLKRIRLDFGSDRSTVVVKIEEITLSNNEGPIWSCSGEDLFSSISRHSRDIVPQKKTMNYVAKRGDPYLVFQPILRLMTPWYFYYLAFIFPFLGIMLVPIKNSIERILKRKDFHALFFTLFIISIPLKNAWTTFICLLFVAYALVRIFKDRRFEIKTETILFCALFFIPAVFGAATSYAQINIILSFLLFGVVSVCKSEFDHDAIYKTYCVFCAVIACALLSSWAANLFIFSDFNDMSFLHYFRDIKYENEKIRFWLSFSHAAFLGVFVNMGAVYAQYLHERKKLATPDFFGMLALCLLLNIVLGSRMALASFLIVALFLIFGKRRYLWPMVLTYIGLFSLVYASVQKIDPSRYQLWSVALQGFLEKPIVGHGLNSSALVLEQFNKSENFSYDLIEKLNHPHNQLISYLLEIGLLGTALLLIFIAALHIKNAGKLNFRYFAVLFFFSCLSLVESPFETSKPTFMFCFLLLLANTKPLKSIWFGNRDKVFLRKA